MAGTKRLAVDLEEELHRGLKEIAAGEGRSVSGVVRQLLTDWVKRKTTPGSPDAAELPEFVKEVQKVIVGTQIRSLGNAKEAKDDGEA